MIVAFNSSSFSRKDSRFTKLLYIPRTYSFAKKTRGTDRDGTTPKLPPTIVRTFIISTAPFFFRYAFCKGPGTGSGCMCLVPVPSLMIIIFSINHSEVGTVVDLLPVQLRTIGFSTGEIWSSLVEHVSVVHTWAPGTAVQAKTVENSKNRYFDLGVVERFSKKERNAFWAFLRKCNVCYA